jgi:hypothetical protein
MVLLGMSTLRSVVRVALAAVMVTGVLAVMPTEASAQSVPTVSIVSPTAGGVLTGTSATVTATAAPSVGNTVVCVAFDFVGLGEVAFTCNPPTLNGSGQPIYSATVDTTFYSGVQQLTAVVDDSSGTSATSFPVEVVVNPGAFHGLTPSRILDTRDGTGFGTGTTGPVGAHSTVDLFVNGSNGVPGSGVSAVVLNVTVTGPQQSGFLTVYPDGGAQPFASNLNFSAGQTVANLVTVGDSDDEVDFYNGSPGDVQIVADVVGYYTDGSADSTDPSGRLVALTPSRILDTRDGTGAPAAPIASDGTLSFQVSGRGGVPSSGAGGVVLNLTETSATAAGFVTAWPSDAGQPLASSLNFVAGETVPNLVELPLGPSGSVSLYNSFGGTIDAIADVVGYYTGASASLSLDGLYTALPPARVLDTRFGTGAPEAPVGPYSSITVQVTGAGGVPTGGVTAIALNVTATQPQQAGYLTVYPAGAGQPLASNLNFVAGQTVPNLVLCGVSQQGSVTIYNGSPGTVEVVADVQGFFS